MFTTYTSPQTYPITEWCKVYFLEVSLYGLLREHCQEYKMIQRPDLLVERLLRDLQTTLQFEDCHSIGFTNTFLNNEIDYINTFLKALDNADVIDGQWDRILREEVLLMCISKSSEFRNFIANPMMVL